MKNFVSIFLFLQLLLAVGCNKMEVNSSSSQNSSSDLCELQVSLGGVDFMATKVTGQTYDKESMIQNIQLFVFRTGTDDGGVLDAALSAGFDTPLDYNASASGGKYSCPSLRCTVGSREVWAVINAPSDYTKDGSVGNKSDLLSKTITLKDNASNKLFMIGSKGDEFKSGTQSVDVAVKRACASIVLKSIKNDMEAAIYRKSGTFKIKSVYLINVPARMNYAQNTTAASLLEQDWYAKLGKESDSSKAALISDSSAEEVVDYGKASSDVHTFYMFANSCETSTSASWSPRASCLVVEAAYNDGAAWHDCYYPIPLHKTDVNIEANKSYTVSLTIRRPGSTDPNKPVEFDDVSGTITVSQWDNGAEYTETI